MKLLLVFLVLLVNTFNLNKINCQRNWHNDHPSNIIRDAKSFDEKIYFPGKTNEAEINIKRLNNALSSNKNFINENNSNRIDDDILPSNTRRPSEILKTVRDVKPEMTSSTSRHTSAIRKTFGLNQDEKIEKIHNSSEESGEKRTKSNKRKYIASDSEEKTNMKPSSSILAAAMGLFTTKLRVCEKKYAEYIKRIFPEETDTASDANDSEFNGRVLAAPGEYPHMTALGFRSKNGKSDYKCGGSLISERFVITAAHCTNFTGLLPNRVRIGDLNLMIEESYLEPQIREIKRIYVHPDYKTNSYYNDIALLELAEEVELTEFVRPIRLWTNSSIPFNTAYAMGYGATAFAKERTNRLTNLNMTLVPNDVCNREMPKLPETERGIIESQICAKDYKLNRDTCQGDSGGPLQLNIKGRRRQNRLHYQLIGITSYGLYCRSGYPSIFTRVSSYLDWIELIVWREDFE